MTPEQYRESRKGEETSRRGRFMLIGVILATVLAVVLGWYVGIGRYVDTPQLIGRTEAQAVKEAEDAGFTFSVEKRAYSETAPLGTIISTNPDPGDRILPGDTIEGVVSQGKERYDIPSLKGQSVDEATAALEKLHLKVGDLSTAFSETVDKGKVVGAADFKVGFPVKRNTAVDLVVSKGRKPIEITDYTGQKESEATEGLEKVGFKAAVEREFSDDVDKGIVISQSPNDGEGYKDDTITLEVSRGPESVEVPNVIGEARNQARKTLEDAGFKVRVFGPGNFVVRAQTPPADGKAKVGSTVTIAGF